MCFGSSRPAETPTPAPAPPPPSLPAEQTALGSRRKKENQARWGAGGGPQARRDSSADSGLSGGSGLRM